MTAHRTVTLVLSTLTLCAAGWVAAAPGHTASGDRPAALTPSAVPAR